MGHRRKDRRHLSLSKRIEAGRPRDSQLLLSLEDERLVGMSAADLGWMLEEHARRFPRPREAKSLTVYLDEVHLVDGWETLVRRLMDEGGLELFVSGSSAKLLSREVATSLRGRAMEILIHPFSFREALRHEGQEPDAPSAWIRPTAQRSTLGCFGTWSKEGSPRLNKSNAATASPS